MEKAKNTQALLARKSFEADITILSGPFL